MGKTLVFVALIGLVLGQPIADEEEHEVEKRSVFRDQRISLTGGERIVKRSLEDALEDIEVAESGAIFLPRGFKKRSRRSADLDEAESGAIFLPRGFKKRSRRSADLDEAESGAIFLPRGFKKRSKRSADLDEAESGAIFLPRGFKKRSRRSADLDEAESGAIFLPRGFKKRSRRSADLDEAEEQHEVEKRSIFRDQTISLTGGEKIVKRSIEDALEDIEVAESGAIFLPRGFKKRSRRSADLDEAETIFLPSFRRGKRSAQDLDGAESGAIFIPAFRRGKRSLEDDGEVREKRATIALPVQFKKKLVKK